MSTYLYPTHSQRISAADHDKIEPAARAWAAGSGTESFTVDSATDRIQICGGGAMELEGALAEVAEWVRRMTAVGKTFYVASEWPAMFELRNAFDTALSSNGYKAVPKATGGYVILGASDVEIGKITATPQGWVASRTSAFPGTTTVKSDPQTHPQLAFEHFIRIDGFTV